ncbi:MAG: type II secretion system protein GspE, partial [Thalassovita sp.]
LPIPAHVWQANGCPACNGAGHKGRAGIYEIVTMDDGLRGAIDAGASEQALKVQALTPDRTLLGEAMQLVAQGITDSAEVVRVVGTEL